MSKPVFEEEQRFNQWWIYLLLTAAILAVAYTGYQEYLESQNLKAFSSLLIFAPLALLIFFIRLRTRIDEKGIQVQFFPLHLSLVLYPWSEIYSAEALKYSPIGDYGGWGFRISFKGKGKAFSVRGSQGIRIQTDEGKVRMIGTQKPSEAQAVIEKYLSKDS